MVMELEKAFIMHNIQCSKAYGNYVEARLGLFSAQEWCYSFNKKFSVVHRVCDETI